MSVLGSFMMLIENNFANEGPCDIKEETCYFKIYTHTAELHLRTQKTGTKSNLPGLFHDSKAFIFLMFSAPGQDIRVTI